MTGGSKRVLQKFTARGDFVAQIGGGPAASPISGGVATDRSGHVYVISGDKQSRNWRVLKFTSHGRLIDRWPPMRTRRGRVAGGIATDGAGNVFVGVDRWIEKFNSKGVLLARWKDRVPAHGTFVDVQGGAMATDAAGNVYVTGGLRVAKFTGEGTFVRTWGEAEFGNPAGIAADRAGHVFVSDFKRNRVLEFSTEGAYLGQFGQTGSGNGQFRGPLSLATDARGDLYVADKSNNRIQKFGEPSSAFDFTKTTLDPSHGSARIVVDVAGVGRLDVTGTDLRTVHRIAKGAGEVVLPVEPTGALWAKLGKHGRVTVEVHVAYTPSTPGTVVPASRTRRIALVLSR